MSVKPSITVVSDYDAMSIAAAERVAAVVRRYPDGAITIPTGSTPVGMYTELARRINAGELDFSRVQIFCLDEYLGVTPDDAAALTKLLLRDFLIPANINLDNVHFIPSTADDPDQAAKDYEAEIVAAGGLKLAVIGLGPNGHIGFNEPGSSAETRTRVVDLTRESRDQNAAYYEGATIPERAMSMGIGTIMEAEKVVMIVNGASKAGIVKEMVEGPMTSDLPGSWMGLAGSRAELIVEAEAAAELNLA
ncbi:MAG: glucosamine-6-phosphate deaminase [Thermomicrobiales bacterium]|nr:glucosamine-6-phosphate deaminase [Thermomicrobiales bacterium]MCO5223965.1 glucosamine-6-phosphate deaminase [Thermomicrobiales bacterium]